MVLLLVSSFLTGDETLAYVLLLLATASLGAGFGFAVPALNTFTAAFNPGAVDRSILVLNALLGLGTVLAPVFVAIFDGLGFWWGLPLVVAALLVLLLVVSFGLPLAVDAPRAAASSERSGIPRRFWVYAGFAVLYGICETINGNWSQLDMTDLGASTTRGLPGADGVLGDGDPWASPLRLRAARLPARLTYHVLPFVLVVAFVLIALLPDDEPVLGIVAFGLAGLGCSALLPLTISFGQSELTAFSAAAAGGIIAFYQLGYGIAAFGTGPLLDGGTELSTVYAIAAAVAAVMGLWSFVVARRPDSTTVHAQPA